MRKTIFQRNLKVSWKYKLSSTNMQYSFEWKPLIILDKNVSHLELYIECNLSCI